jgi:hypothetical protein
MEEPEKYVNWTANALLMVSDIYDYLENVSREDFASRYIDDLLEYGNTLNTKSEHFPYCRNDKLLAVIHSKRSPEVFEAVDDDT